MYHFCDTLHNAYSINLAMYMLKAWSHYTGKLIKLIITIGILGEQKWLHDIYNNSDDILFFGSTTPLKFILPLLRANLQNICIYWKENKIEREVGVAFGQLLPSLIFFHN